MIGWLTVHSAWWGKSFVNELTRISEHADKKLVVRHSTLPAEREEVRKEVKIQAPSTTPLDGEAKGTEAVA
jgi:hypothetical protein